MAPHSSALAWRTPWMEESGGLQSMGSLRVGHDSATSLSLFTVMHWRRKWQPTPCSCLENPRDGGSWWAAVSGVAQSRTRLKRRSSTWTLENKVEFKEAKVTCTHVINRNSIAILEPVFLMVAHAHVHTVEIILHSII